MKITCENRFESGNNTFGPNQGTLYYQILYLFQRYRGLFKQVGMFN